MPKLTITFDVPDGIYCGIVGLNGPMSDVSWPLKVEDCERKTSNLPRLG